MNWDEWKAELVKIVGDAYGPGGPIAQCGEESWRHYFDDGVSPEQAFHEDISYAEPD